MISMLEGRPGRARRSRCPTRRSFASGTWEVWDGWRLQGDLIATEVQHDLTFYDARAQQLTINGAPQFLPDGRIRYDGLGAVPIPSIAMRILWIRVIRLRHGAGG